jgi:O-acetyl-ADP-ribose deacetylase (regulator of RNase III)
MIKYEKGNVFDHLNKPCIFVHGCNAQKVMGSGVAKTIKGLYPEVYKAYLEMDMSLGNVSYVKYPNGLIMANAITQKRYGNDGRIYVDYSAVLVAMEHVALEAESWQLPIKMPFIGAGLGGGDKETLKSIFEDAFGDLDVTVFSLEN